MDHIKILKRAFKITWDYKVLWIFGIILALTVAGTSYPGSPGNPGSSGDQVKYVEDDGGEIPETIELPDGREIDTPQTPEEWEDMWNTARDVFLTILAVSVAICGVCCCLILVWIVAWTVLRWVAETALIRMVDDYEETGEKHSIREGFRLGWSHASLRLFLIDLLFFLAGLVIFILVLFLLAPPVGLAIWMFSQGVFALGILSSVVAAGVFFLSIFLAGIVGMAVEFVKPFFYRACVLEDLGVGESLLRGLDIVKRHFAWDVVIMWLLVAGLTIAWDVVSLIIGMVLFFVVFFVAALPALVLGGLASLIFGWIGLIVGGVVGLLSFITVLILVGTLLRGLRMTFLSTLWTLTYRELLALEGLNANGKEPWETEHREEEASHELQ